LKSLGEATTALRKRLGESLSTIHKFDVPIEEVTTPSLEALKELSVGRKVQQVKGNAAAIPYFNRAIELREHVSEREKFRVSAYYFHLVTGEIEKAIDVYELWAQAYPRDNVPRSNLSVTYGYLGQYEKAIAEIQEALRLNPESAVGYTNLVSHYAALNRTADAKDIYRQAVERKLENPYFHLNRYAVAFLENDAGEMQRQIDWAAGKV